MSVFITCSAHTCECYMDITAYYLLQFIDPKAASTVWCQAMWKAMN